MSSYWDREFWGTLWGVKDDEHPNGHHGMDFAHDAGTPIPALRGGLVTKVGESSELGTYITVQVSLSDFDGYCHTRDVVVRRGDRVRAGQLLAEVAGYGDYHGSAWTGPHTHLTNGPVTASTLGINTRDPKPLVLAAIAGPASTGKTSLPDTQGEDDMKPLLLVCADGPSKGAFAVYDSRGIHGVPADREERIAGLQKIVDSAWGTHKPAVELTGAEWVLAVPVLSLT